MLDYIGYGFYALLTVFLLIKFVQAFRIVPAREVYIVERWGKFHKTLQAGFHSLVPFMDVVVHKLTLKEEAIDVPEQICITRDNVQVKVDGVVYMRVVEPEKAAYQISNYRYALIQLAQTTMRSVFGSMDLDKTFEERESINATCVQVVQDAATFWGVDILRYEIQNIKPPASVLESMEKQVTAERDKREVIARSEGDMTAMINVSEGNKQELINESEGEKQKRINEAEGRAEEIRSIARATAEGIRKVAQSIQLRGGAEAVRLDLSESYLKQLRHLADSKTNVVLPMNLGDLNDVLEGLSGYQPGDAKKKG